MAALNASFSSTAPDPAGTGRHPLVARAELVRLLDRQHDNIVGSSFDTLVATALELVGADVPDNVFEAALAVMTDDELAAAAEADASDSVKLAAQVARNRATIADIKATGGRLIQMAVAAGLSAAVSRLDGGV